jgi:beta-lactamase superfamily II metal-dependent hydrolase
LQIHFIKVGQGDAALIVSPLGETLLIDSGPESASSCASATGIITYLASVGLTKLDYHVASHYDADHIGCSDHVAARWPIQKLPTTAAWRMCRRRSNTRNSHGRHREEADAQRRPEHRARRHQ